MYVGGIGANFLRCLRCVCIVLLFGFFMIGSTAQSAEPIDFSVSVVGVADSDLRESILSVSQLLKKSRRPVPTVRALRIRVERSLSRISALLRAHAYYAARQKFHIERKSESSAAVTIEIDLGPAYRIGRYDIRSPAGEKSGEALDIPFSDLGLKPGDVAKSEAISAGDARLLAALSRKGYPLARIENRRIVVDHKTHTLSVEISVETGPLARFGAIRTEGLETVEPGLIARHVTWVRGAVFNSAALEDLRKKLRQTGLFSSVLVRHAKEVDERGELEITVDVKERKHRSIGVGGTYSTTEGALGKLFWEHRNLWGHGERLRIRGEVGEIRQGLFGDFRVADFGSRDQDLVFDGRVTKEQPDGFTSVETAAIARLERRFSTTLAVSAGVGLDRSSVGENNKDRNFTFLTLPMSVRRDTSDDLLDPSKGGRDTLTFTPNIGLIGTDTNFFAAQLFDTVYLPLMPEKKLVLAGWARIGTILGERTLNVPANKRLYAGGAGSVRGYALHSIGPLDVQNDPIGGRSSTELGLELRWRAFGPFGIVAFVEAGGVYGDPIPSWGENLQWGAGLGVRYLTKFGPLRLDVAVPLNRRNSVDDAFQILISLGQAF